MSILDLFRRKVELKDYLRNTKKIRVNGVQFEIRSVNMDDHLAGLNVILSMHKLYKERKKGTPNDPGKVAEDNAKLSKFIRDFVYAGVVSPQLTMKKDGEDGAIHVDEITANGELAQKLCAAILEYSYGKKK